MQWHQTRQGVLAENIANADTPGYRARDLKKLSFDRELSQISGELAAAKTHPSHLSIGSTGGRFKTDKSGQLEITPDGNGVSLEEQMMKVAANQMDYQAATTLYSRGLALLRLAVKRG